MLSPDESLGGVHARGGRLRGFLRMKIRRRVPESIYMPEAVRECLREHFGYSSFREGQENVIRTLLEGRSALAVLPTGGGKSLCYQLPALLFPGVTLVISPLIALMKDQVDRLQRAGIAAERLDSTMAAAEVFAVLTKLEKGELKLLYVAPERLSSDTFVARLKGVEISLLAIDEAHCISEWGHNFRPEYLRIAAVAAKIRVRRILALTATATPLVAKEIRKSFGISRNDHTQTSFHRENLHLQISPVASAERPALLLQKLRAPGRLPAIVYVTLQRTAEDVAAQLQKAGFRARAYHAGLGDDTRRDAQDAFMLGACDVIVATIAFGMGIDKAGIRAVFHYNLPKSLENYQQEIGRAGRDGLPAHCEMLACADDLVVLENFILGDTPGKTALRQLLDSLLRRGEQFDISRYDLSRSTDIRPLVLETILTYLEKEAILEPVGSFYTGYQIGFHTAQERILSGYSVERQRFLGRLFQAGKRGSRWLQLDVQEAAKAISESSERILKALRYLEESGDVELRPKGLRHSYRLLAASARESPSAVADRLYETFQQREKSDLERLQQVVRFAAAPGCRTKALLSYFGEKLEANCGHCCRCDGESALPLPGAAPAEILDADINTLRELAGERHAALRAPRALARFACGLSSPATTRDRLTRDERFGFLEHIPFACVLRQIESMQI